MKYPEKYKHWKKDQAIEDLDSFSEIKGSQLSTFNLMSDMIARYKTPFPSQGWIAEQIHKTIRTAWGATDKLHKAKLIKKKSRGLAFWDKKTGAYKDHTCEYSIGKTLKRKLRNIARYIPQSDPRIAKLIERIPGIRKLLLNFFLLINLLLYSGNIRVNKDYVYNSYVTVCGQYGYEEAKACQKEKIFPTRIVSEADNHIKFTFKDWDYEVADNYPYTVENSISRWSKKRREDPEKGKEIPYPIKPFIPKPYGSHEPARVARERVELEKTCVRATMLKLNDEVNKLTEEQVGIIKSFPAEIIQLAKEALRDCPENKTNFAWIYAYCKDKMMNAPLKNLLNENGFRSARDYKPRSSSSRYPYKPFKATPVASVEDPPKELPQINEKFVQLIGEENFIAYSQRAGFLEKTD